MRVAGGSLGDRKDSMLENSTQLSWILGVHGLQGVELRGERGCSVRPWGQRSVRPLARSRRYSLDFMTDPASHLSLHFFVRVDSIFPNVNKTHIFFS